MTNQELKLKCVELAILKHQSTGGNYLATAKEIEDYIQKSFKPPYEESDFKKPGEAFI